MTRFLVIAVIATLILNECSCEQSATDLAADIFRSCLKDFSTDCVRPKVLPWISNVSDQDEIKITNLMSVVRTTRDALPPVVQGPRDARFDLFERVDNFLNTHAVKITPPAFFKSQEARSMIPDTLLESGLAREVNVPLGGTSTGVTEGRGFMRKVMMPFLLGLKLKTTVLVPIALALIALKTWKAMTLGLLSLVLSGALLIFKIIKPKIVNYEVLHYPTTHHVDHIEHLPHHLEHHIEHVVPHHAEHHVEHVVPHHVEHVVPHHVEHVVPHHVDHFDALPHHIEHTEHVHVENNGWEPSAPWSRSGDDAQEIAYAGQRK